MKCVIWFFLVFTIASSAYSQKKDSLQFEEYINSFSSDIGQYMLNAHCLDSSGQAMSLKKFIGKTIYVNLWSTACAPCLAYYPEQQKLMSEINSLRLKDNIVFLNICADYVEIKDWKNIIAKRYDDAINLYISDTSIFNSWGIRTQWPSYILIDKNGKNLGKRIPAPGEGSVDFILFAANKGVPAFKSIRIARESNQALIEGHPNSVNPLYLDFYIWKQHLSNQ